MESKDNIDFWKNPETQNFRGVLLLLFFGYRIVPTRTPRMAPRYSFHSKPRALHHTPFVDGFNRVLRACGRVAAVRTKHRRQRCLVYSNGEYEEFL
jgi:hypothetical protein